MTYDEYMALAGDLLGWTTDEVYHRQFRSLEALRVLTLTEQLLGLERSGSPVPSEFSDMGDAYQYYQSLLLDDTVGERSRL